MSRCANCHHDSKIHVRSGGEPACALCDCDRFDWEDWQYVVGAGVLMLLAVGVILLLAWVTTSIFGV